MSTTTPGQPLAAKPYRFVGGYTLIHGHDELKQFSQRTMLDDEQAETVLRGGGMILPEADFFTFFTPEEVKAKGFPTFPGHWLSAPAELQAKKKAATALALSRHYELVDAAEKVELQRVAAIVAARKAEAEAKTAALQLPAETPAAPVEIETEKETN